MSFGEYIKQLRKDKGLSLREIAKRTKMSSSYLSQLENGHNINPKKEMLIKLAPVLGTSYTDLLMETDLMEGSKDTILKNLNNDADKITEHYERHRKFELEYDEKVNLQKKLVERGFTTSETPSLVYALEDFLSDKILVNLDGRYLTNDDKKEILNYARFLNKKGIE